MPKLRYKQFVEKLEKSSAFSFKQIEAKLGKNYAKTFIHTLAERGRIVKLLKGWYTFKKSPYLITIPLGKAYIGLGTAAFLHGAWNQVPIVCVLSPNASLKARSGMRVVAGWNVLIKKISDKMYFGYEEKFFEDIEEWIRVSDIEKTLIDIVYYDYAFAGEIIPKLMEMASRKKLEKYIKMMKARKVGKWKRVSEKIFSYRCSVA